MLEEVRREQQAGLVVDAEVLDTARGPLEVATAYRSMYAYGNHLRIRSSEQSLQTADSGVAATFRQVCRNGLSDGNAVDADVEYVGHIEEILELNYRRHCIVVLVCDFVKANYAGENATIVKDKWGFTLANYARRPGIVCRDSFAFPKHCDQVFYAEAREAPGWKVVLRKEVRGRRVLPSTGEDRETELFNMGDDEDFEGLRPDREVGENPGDEIFTGQDVELEEVLRQGRQRTGRAHGRQGHSQQRRRGLAARTPGTVHSCRGRRRGGNVSTVGAFDAMHVAGRGSQGAREEVGEASNRNNETFGSSRRRQGFGRRSTETKEPASNGTPKKPGCPRRVHRMRSVYVRALHAHGQFRCVCDNAYLVAS